MVVQHLIGPSSLHSSAIGPHALSILSYNVLLPNSQDGWWTYKMYNPPLSTQEQQKIATWNHRRDQIQKRLAQVQAGIVCLQEVAPDSFVEDFAFMQDLGYDECEMFKKGRFRPATFWKSAEYELVAPPVHKDRTLLTAFRPKHDGTDDGNARNWYVLNCHLQAGPEAPRRVRQINEGMRAVLTLARKLKEKEPEKNIPVIVCGDFNGGQECGAVQYLEEGFVDENFIEDGKPVSSGKKALPLAQPLTDVMSVPDHRPPPPTLVVAELISILVDQSNDAATTAYQDPELAPEILERLSHIFHRLSTATNDTGDAVMTTANVKEWLTIINGQVGRGSEFRAAAKLMTTSSKEDDTTMATKDEKELETERIELSEDGTLSLEAFQNVYWQELRQGKFWGIAHDLAVLGEVLPNVGNFEGRYDRLYCSAAVAPMAVMDFVSKDPCPNPLEPSDHLPIAAAFQIA